MEWLKRINEQWGNSTNKRKQKELKYNPKRKGHCKEHFMIRKRTLKTIFEDTVEREKMKLKLLDGIQRGVYMEGSVIVDNSAFEPANRQRPMEGKYRKENIISKILNPWFKMISVAIISVRRRWRWWKDKCVCQFRIFLSLKKYHSAFSHRIFPGKRIYHHYVTIIYVSCTLVFRNRYALLAQAVRCDTNFIYFNNGKL